METCNEVTDSICVDSIVTETIDPSANGSSGFTEYIREDNVVEDVNNDTIEDVNDEANEEEPAKPVGDELLDLENINLDLLTEDEVKAYNKHLKKIGVEFDTNIKKFNKPKLYYYAKDFCLKTYIGTKLLPYLNKEIPLYLNRFYPDRIAWKPIQEEFLGEIHISISIPLKKYLKNWTEIHERSHEFILHKPSKYIDDRNGLPFTDPMTFHGSMNTFDNIHYPLRIRERDGFNIKLSKVKLEYERVGYEYSNRKNSKTSNGRCWYSYKTNRPCKFRIVPAWYYAKSIYFNNKWFYPYESTEDSKITLLEHHNDMLVTDFILVEEEGQPMKICLAPGKCSKFFQDDVVGCYIQ